MALAQTYAATEAHRVQQRQLSLTTQLVMLRLFGLLDPFDLEGTVDRWLRLVIPLLRRQHDLSAALAVRYVAQARALEVPGAPPFTPTPAPFNAEQATASMMVMGPRRLEQARERIREISPERIPPPVLEKVAQSAARSADRLTREGERSTIYSAANDDPVARGYMRIGDGNSCFFCALLISRGPVYQDDSFDESDERFHGPGKHKVHDGCGCTVMPVYGTDNNVPDRTRELDELYGQAKELANQAGIPTILAFRRLFEGRV